MIAVPLSDGHTGIYRYSAASRGVILPTLPRYGDRAECGDWEGVDAANQVRQRHPGKVQHGEEQPCQDAAGSGSQADQGHVRRRLQA
ncbi:unnamed protein product [Phytophthora fragariaefolia]|uniref:Unnamed protein product n=1 Tax=Phytophthora fragariaefolia TaxID=1490495 RepID=A0A9W6YQN8_9STRA|nr:unnamed protein product [Phytophthora fragariaefolia]